MFRRHTFHLHLCGLLFVCFSHLHTSNKSHFQHSNTVMLLIPFSCTLLCVCFSVYSDYITAVTFTPAANGFLMDSLFLGSPLHHCQSASNPPPIGQRCSVDQMAGPSNWPESSGGKEGIDLSVVLEDQLIPIVCASTDSPMCLIWYGLFLLGQDKSLSHHFPL